MRLGVEEETGVSGRERASPQGSSAINDAGEDRRQRGVEIGEAQARFCTRGDGDDGEVGVKGMMGCEIDGDPAQHKRSALHDGKKLIEELYGNH
ncbi:hypothetical protein AAC387_Pa04g1248 [Persea americana]